MAAKKTAKKTPAKKAAKKAAAAPEAAPEETGRVEMAPALKSVTTQALNPAFGPAE